MGAKLVYSGTKQILPENFLASPPLKNSNYPCYKNSDKIEIMSNFAQSLRSGGYSSSATEARKRRLNLPLYCNVIIVTSQFPKLRGSHHN